MHHKVSKIFLLLSTVRKISLWSNFNQVRLRAKTGNAMGYSLSIGLLQQGYPKGSGGGAAWEAESRIDARQAVIDGHLCPVSQLPKTKPEGAPVLAVAPLWLVWRQHLQRIMDQVQFRTRLRPIIQFSRFCFNPGLLPCSTDVCSWARRCRHRETSSLLVSLVWHDPGWCYQGRELVIGRFPGCAK